MNNDARDERTGVKAEADFIVGSGHVAAVFRLDSPPAEWAIPCDFLDTIRGRSVTVASFASGHRDPVFHRRLRAWSEIYARTPQGADPYRWRVDVVTEEDWRLNKRTGAAPSRVESFPATFAWIEEEGAEELPRPLP
jgi:hypothetical protein